MKLENLTNECIDYILLYLRAHDLAQVAMTSKSLFTRHRIAYAVHYQLTDIYEVLVPPTIPLASDVLFVVEIKSLLTALTSSQPLTGKGYWISTSWVTNARKYYESLTLPDNFLTTKGKPVSKKQIKIRQRRGSDALPPWPAINAEITCSHGCLAASKLTKSKRKLIDQKSWKMLRRFYHLGHEFKSPRTPECSECIAEEDARNLAASERKEENSRLHQLPPELLALYNRRSGVPSHLVRRKSLDELNGSLSSSPQQESSIVKFIDESDYLDFELTEEDLMAISLGYPASSMMTMDSTPREIPLAPGIYVVLPRKWLVGWRQFTKDSSNSHLFQLDSTCFLCPAHNRLVVPPHLDEYLRGYRKYLLGGLGTYPGIKVELLSLEEWEILSSSLYGSFSEFYVSFSNDGENISWAMETCLSCDPINYDPRRVRNHARCNPNRSPNMYQTATIV